MIILDTNVLSEAGKPSPSAKVMNWWDQQRNADLFITSVTQAELLLGVALLPHGRRRTALQLALDRMIHENFAGRILSFDSAAAHEFVGITATRKKLGRPIGYADAQIAAIARTQAAPIATRDIQDFANCGIELVNPWE